MNPNSKKSWLFEYIVEVIYLVIITAAFLAVGFSITATVVIVLVKWTYTTFVIHKPGRSNLYRLPTMLCKGKVFEKKLRKPIFTEFFCEWIIFKTEAGEQIKAYITVPFNANERKNLNIFNIGDTGTLHYRQGKKHLYFEDFVKSESNSETSED